MGSGNEIIFINLILKSKICILIVLNYVHIIYDIISTHAESKVLSKSVHPKKRKCNCNVLMENFLISPSLESMSVILSVKPLFSILIHTVITT